MIEEAEEAPTRVREESESWTRFRPGEAMDDCKDSSDSEVRIAVEQEVEGQSVREQRRPRKMLERRPDVDKCERQRRHRRDGCKG